MVIFMTDHGSRHGPLRNTYYGKLEERLPFFSILVPKWFQTKYPLAYQNLRKNKDRLTSPYDIYQTLKHILNLKDFRPGTLKERSISLFREVSKQVARFRSKVFMNYFFRFQQTEVVLMLLSNLIGVRV